MWCVSQVRGGFTVSRQSTAASAVISGRPAAAAAAAVGDEGSELARRHHKRRRRQNRSDQLTPSHRRQHQQLLTADQEELTKEMLSITEPKIQTNKTELITSQVRYNVALIDASTLLPTRQKPIWYNESDVRNLIKCAAILVNGTWGAFKCSLGKSFFLVT